MTERFDWLEYDERQAAPPDAPAPRDVRQIVLDATRAWSECEYDAALRLYSNALEADKARLDAWAGQIRCLVRLGEHREAQSWATRACKLFPHVAQLESARAYALACSGLIAPAMAASDGALELAEKSGLADPRIWIERGVCLLADGQRSTASFCFGKAREICPNEPDIAQEIGIELLASGDAAGALSTFTAVIDSHPQRAGTWILIAQAANRLDMKARANEALDRAAGLRPAHPALVAERAAAQDGWWTRLRRRFGI